MSTFNSKAIFLNIFHVIFQIFNFIFKEDSF